MNENKGDAGNIAELINLDHEPTELTMNQSNTNQNKFQYDCRFCQCDLPNGGTRFNGFGACPRCFRLAHHLVNGLRTHWQNYFSNWGVRK